MELLMILSTFPLFFYLVDGYYEKNMKRGVFQILGFLGVVIALAIMISVFGWTSVLVVPVLVLVLVLIRNSTSN